MPIWVLCRPKMPHVAIDKLADGRLICVTRRPMVGRRLGCATHEDVTERQQFAETTRTWPLQEAHAACRSITPLSFRTRVEEVLGNRSDNTKSIKTTATALFGSSDQTKARVMPLRRSNKASANVATLAVLPNSIALDSPASTKLADHRDRKQCGGQKVEATNKWYRPASQGQPSTRRRRQAHSGVAGQTNLLALNATIEAARAGRSRRADSRSLRPK